MIIDHWQVRPRYSDVDQMGYVYHANHVSFCHQARTELLRKLGIHDAMLEDKGVMLPVISFDIKYKTPAKYDELITITTKVEQMPCARFAFKFELRNEEKVLVSKAKSEVVFVDKSTRKPMVVPPFIKEVLEKTFIQEKEELGIRN